MKLGNAPDLDEWGAGMIDVLNWISTNPVPAFWVGVFLYGIAYALGPKERS